MQQRVSAGIMALVLAIFLVLPCAAFAGVIKDVSYGSVKEQTLDIYTPGKQQQNTPVMIYVHGGAWALGDKANVASKPGAFNNAGYIFISLNYPLVPDGTVEQQAQSVADAVRWVRTNIIRYGGSKTSPIALMGHSSGAHLVALVGTDRKYLEKNGLTLKDIKAVVPVDAATLNVPETMTVYYPDFSPAGQKMYQDALGSNPVRWARLSPFHHLDIGQAYPPFLCLSQASYTTTQANAFSARLRVLKGIAESFTVEDRTHKTINEKFGEDGDVAFKKTIQFLNRIP